MATFGHAKSDPAPLNPEQYPSAVDWVVEVHKVSRNKLLSTVLGGLRTGVAIASLGASEMEFRALPLPLRQFDRRAVRFVRVQPDVWTKGTYGVPALAATGYREARAMALKALVDHCLSRSGEAVFSGADGLIFCDVAGVPIYAADVPASKVEGEGPAFSSVIEPSTASDQAHFSKIARELGFGDGSARSVLTAVRAVFPGYLPGAGYVHELVGTLCPEVSRALVTQGVVREAKPYRGVASTGTSSVVTLAYTFCKLDLKFDTPKALFNANYDFEKRDALERVEVGVRTAMEDRCEARSGTLEASRFQSRGGGMLSAWSCVTGADGTVHFMYYQASEYLGMHRLSILEPTSDAAAHDPSYIQMLREYGYITRQEWQAKNEAQRETAAKEAIRAEWMRPGKQKVGARLCQEQNGFLYIGYVEQKSPDSEKVQIRIADAHLRSNPGLKAAGFQSSIVWDHPDRWELCEN